MPDTPAPDPDHGSLDQAVVTIETDGTISPSVALHKAANVLKDHFEKVAALNVQELETPKVVAETAPKKRGRPKKEK